MYIPLELLHLPRVFGHEREKLGAHLHVARVVDVHRGLCSVPIGRAPILKKRHTRVIALIKLKVFSPPSPHHAKCWNHNLTFYLAISN